MEIGKFYFSLPEASYQTLESTSLPLTLFLGQVPESQLMPVSCSHTPTQLRVPPASLQPQTAGHFSHSHGASGPRGPTLARAPARSTFPSSCFTGHLVVPADLLPWQPLPPTPSHHGARSGSRASSLLGHVQCPEPPASPTASIATWEPRSPACLPGPLRRCSLLLVPSLPHTRMLCL